MLYKSLILKNARGIKPINYKGSGSSNYDCKDESKLRCMNGVHVK